MKKIIKILLVLFMIPIQGCSKNTVNWLIFDYFNQEEITVLEDNINNYLSDINKNYQINIYTYPYKTTYEEIIKLVNKNNIDIVYINTHNDSPDSYILKMINDEYCEEIESTFEDIQLMKYNNKIYGYGNKKVITSTGIAYTKEFIESTNIDIEDMSFDIKIDDNINEYGKTHQNFINIAATAPNLYKIDELYYIDVQTGECGYYYEHNEIVKLMELNRQLIQSGYTLNPSLMSSASEDNGFFMSDETYFKDSNIMDYSLFYEKDIIYKNYFYQYQQNNVNNIENIIYKESKNKDTAKDFLEELYTNKELCSLIVYNDKNKQLKDDYTYSEWCELVTDYSSICNENLVDLPFNWDSERKENALKEYNEEYKDSVIDGFYFELDEEKMDIYNNVMDIYKPGGSYVGDSLKLNNMSMDYEDAWSNLRAQIDDNGGDIILNELQRQVNEYIEGSDD